MEQLAEKKSLIGEIVRRPRLLAAGGVGFLAVVGLVLGLLFAFGAFAKSDPPGPRLSLADTVRLDMKLGESGEKTVAFKNGGTQPLKLSIVRTHAAPDSICGCGITSSEVRPQEVAPGADGELAFNISAEGMTKPMKDKILVDLESNDAGHPKRTITILLTMSQ